MNILVVDDEKEIADLVELYLANDGYRIFKFYNAADALAIALCHARSYTSRLQSPDAARPGSGRYAVRKD